MTTRWLDELLQDIRFGVRSLLKSVGWSATVVLMLAMGIGLTTAIFSVVYGVLLRQLPYREPDRLVAIWMASKTVPRMNVSPAFWRDWRAQAQSFEDITLVRPVANFNLTGTGHAERLQGARTSWNVATVLGVQPLVGRWFTEEETQRDATVAVLSSSLWQRRFGADPTIVGRTVQLNGSAFEIIGVMPWSFRYPTREFELWTPLYVPEETFRFGTDNSYVSVARLRPSITLDQAQAELRTITPQISVNYPAVRSAAGETTATVEPLQSSDVTEVRRPLYVLMAGAGCLLLVGCLSLALLLIGKGTARQREVAVRVALGASSGRIVRQMMAETLPLAFAGAVGGLVLSIWMIGMLLQWVPPTLPRAETIGLHTPVVLFAMCASVLVVLGASLWPAKLAMKSSLQFGPQGTSRVTGMLTAQSRIVVMQLAATMVVVFAGALFAQSAAALFRVHLGFAPHQVLTMHLAVTRAEYPRDADVSNYYRRLEERVEGLPGVLAAGFVNRLPLSGTVQINPMQFERRPDLGSIATDSRSATRGYFEAMGIPLRAGRLFLESDRETSRLVGLIDDTLARRVFGDTNPIGQRFRLGVGEMHGPWVEIVGVVGHIRHDSPQIDLRSQVYFPQTQRTQDRAALVVKTSGDPTALVAAVIEQIQQENPDQPVFDVRTMDEWRERAILPQRLLSGLVSLFGIAALVLASVGLYGVVSHATSLRMREFAIRVALGARPGDVRGLVVWQATRLALIGLGAGIALAFPVGGALQGLLFQVRGSDPATLVIAGIVLMGICLFAAAVPARQATRADPALALRAE
jgi:putative ABC transport system permease protein